VFGSDRSAGIAVRWSGVLPADVSTAGTARDGFTGGCKRVSMGNRRAFEWSGSDYLSDWLSAGRPGHLLRKSGDQRKPRPSGAWDGASSRVRDRLGGTANCRQNDGERYFL